MKKRIIIKDWYVLPSWGRGLAVGAIVGSILMIPLAFLVRDYYTLPIPFAVFLACLIAGFIIGKKNKSFGLKHQKKLLKQENQPRI